MACCLGAQIPHYGHSQNCRGSAGRYDSKLGTVVPIQDESPKVEVSRAVEMNEHEIELHKTIHSLRAQLKVATDVLEDLVRAARTLSDESERVCLSELENGRKLPWLAQAINDVNKVVTKIQERQK